MKEATKALKGAGLRHTSHVNYATHEVGFTCQMGRVMRSGRMTEWTDGRKVHHTRERYYEFSGVKVMFWGRGTDVAAKAEDIAKAGFEVTVALIDGKPIHVMANFYGKPGVRYWEVGRKE